MAHMIWVSLTWSRLRIQNFRKVFENKNGQAVTADVKNQIKIVTLTQLSCIHSNFEYQVSSRDTVKTQPHEFNRVISGKFSRGF